MFELPGAEAGLGSKELARILEDVPVGITVQAADGRLVYANREGLSLLEVKDLAELVQLAPGELAGRYEIFDERDVPFPAEELPGRRALRGLATAERILRFRRRDTGKERVVRLRAEPLRSADGEIRFAINVWTDVTGFTRARDELRMRTALLEAETELTTQGILHADARGRLLSCNARLCELVGRTREEILSGGEREFLLAFAQQAAHAARLTALAAGPLPRGRVQTRVLLRDRRSFELNVMPLRGRHGRLFGRIWFIRELTQDRRMERRRRQTLREHAAVALAEARLRRSVFLAEASRLLAHDLDPHSSFPAVARLAVPFLADYFLVDLAADGRIVREAAAAGAPDDAARSDLLRGCAPLAYGESELLEAMRQHTSRAGGLAAPERLFGACAAAVAASGAERFLCTPLCGRERVLGALTLLFLPGRDPESIEPPLIEALAGRMAAAVENAQLYQQAVEAVRARDEFLSVAAHELRTPVTALEFALQLLRRALGPKGRDDRLRGALEIAQRQGRRLTKLIDNLFEVARAQTEPLPLRLEWVDLSALVRRLGERLEGELASAGCALLLFAETPVIGRWDRLRVEQIVSNLVSNAAKYGAGRPVEVRVSAGARRARIQIADRGIGIAREEQARIFDRYQRGVSARHYGGLGLGLFITQQLVEALGGSVAVESEPGAGAIFTVELPMEGPGAQAAPELIAPGGHR